MLGLTYVIADDDDERAKAIQTGIARLMERPRRLAVNPPPHRLPSQLARHGAGMCEALKLSGCLVVGLPASPMSIAMLGIAVGLGRKVFVVAPDHDTLREHELPLFHIGHSEDPEIKKPVHPSATTIVVGDGAAAAEAVIDWWAGYSVAVQQQAAEIRAVVLEFEGGGRYWESRLNGAERLVMLSEVYDGDAPRTPDGTGLHALPPGERHLVIVDKGKAPPISDSVLHNVARLLHVTPPGER